MPDTDPTESASNARALWEKNVDIVTAFLVTNGQIEITLVAAYSTALAFLATWGNTLASDDKTLTFSIIIPMLSIAVLALSVNVYSWIYIQISYLRRHALNPGNMYSAITYFSYRDAIDQHWNGIPRMRRILIYISRGLRSFILIPLNIRDIYCYYFLIYIISPIGSVLYVTEGSDQILRISVLMLLQFIIFVFGLRERLAADSLIRSQLGSH